MALNLSSSKVLHDPRVPRRSTPAAHRPPPTLVPANAWRILNARTGGAVSRPTFYRWLSNGKIYAVRVGHRLYIPWPVLDELIGQCLAGERIDR